MRDGFYSPASLSIHLQCHWCRFDSAPMTPQSEQAWLNCWTGIAFAWLTFSRKKKETVNQTVCWKRPDQLCMSPSTSLLLLWPQTWSYSSKNILRPCPSQQCFRRAFHQREQFSFLSHADTLHCRETCLCSHLCLEITTAQEHERIFPHTVGALKNFQ